MSALNALALAALLAIAAQAAAPNAPKKENSVAMRAIPDATIHAHVRRYL